MHAKERRCVSLFVPLNRDNHMLTELNADNLDGVIDAAQSPVLVDFWAPWCAPCRMQLPILESLADKAAAGYRIAKVNVDEQPEIARRFGITAMPTLLLFKHGKPIQRFVGVQREPVLQKALQQAG